MFSVLSGPHDTLSSTPSPLKVFAYRFYSVSLKDRLCVDSFNRNAFSRVYKLLLRKCFALNNAEEFESAGANDDVVFMAQARAAHTGTVDLCSSDAAGPSTHSVSSGFVSIAKQYRTNLQSGIECITTGKSHSEFLTPLFSLSFKFLPTVGYCVKQILLLKLISSFANTAIIAVR